MAAKRKKKKISIEEMISDYFAGVAHSGAATIENIRQRYSPRPKRLSSVCVCVDFWDKLRITLPFNKKHFDETIIVTSIKDVRTKALCRKHNVKCVVTDSFFEKGAEFNKANGMNKGLAAVSLNDWVCIWDADTLFPENFRDLFEKYCKDVKAVYGGRGRRELKSEEACLGYIRQTRLLAQSPWGFCQVYHYGSQREKAYDEQYGAADSSDWTFRREFERHYLFPGYFVHLGDEKVNWEGKTDDHWLTKRQVMGKLFKWNLRKLFRRTLPEKRKPAGGKKLSAVMICVDYWDKLALTLPLNKRHFDEIIVVTSTKDKITQKICRAYKVKCIVTDRFFEEGAPFNKAKGVNAGLKAISLNDWVCICDPDTIYPDNFRDMFEKNCTARTALYGSNCNRRKILARKEDYLKYMKERKEPKIYQGMPWGFCQVYNYRFNSGRRYDGRRHSTAASCDTAFSKIFPERKRFRFRLTFAHLGIVNINRRGRIEPFWDKSEMKGQEL